MKLQELVSYLNRELNASAFADYCPNGLQVEGKSEVKKLVTGVTACQDLIDAAIDEKADAIFVHHGYFWKGEPQAIAGMKKNRIQALLKHDISLLAYHLPLDCHAAWGNNVQLAQVLDFEVTGPLDPSNPKTPGNIGRLKHAMKASELATHIGERLNRMPQHIGEDSDLIETIAWCTGGAQGYMSYAMEQGIDAYLTGEINEPVVHNARETGCHFYAAGHHATERYGAKAVGEHLAQEFGLDVSFIDIDNPA
ncbi:Nif3-like dinuclear metal center hexameric protein [Bermanella marisrubri]|uniref:GTP cyclohydrolase 1 type 2 homolog n=1 Tax=Bermanella marisrubri TaxID=207949 RepID=Q1MYN9_9GAMM|nr:Nif3-like dinuclear metal center hexameric protein [Bermanella marisrubri]EAT11077.1 NIF3 [Oceanobacter sp. RED65] [Bermanella marisrubri]QIZ83420.1 Nif3-like dinuclear metal center hexameric protein [Bermanella marisrubri]